MRRPRATYPDTSRKMSYTIGTPATVAIISHQTDLIAQYVEDYCQNIWFPEFLDQLNRYTDENKGKFDIVAALGMVELADEELTGVIPSNVETEAESEWQAIGWYTDEYGVKKWGVIPKQNRIVTQFTWNIDDQNINHSSDPRQNYGYGRT